eukprot:GHVR01179699.1.p1 GENE.GHVR01179699.1~~GHVR01179699.1.p1  ORF type:complete len:359 (+),score=22.49 GHVR01179699.1:162-1079(+)
MIRKKCCNCNGVNATCTSCRCAKAERGCTNCSLKCDCRNRFNSSTNQSLAPPAPNGLVSPPIYHNDTITTTIKKKKSKTKKKKKNNQKNQNFCQSGQTRKSFSLETKRIQQNIDPKAPPGLKINIRDPQSDPAAFAAVSESLTTQVHSVQDNIICEGVSEELHNQEEIYDLDNSNLNEEEYLTFEEPPPGLEIYGKFPPGLACAHGNTSKDATDYLSAEITPPSIEEYLTPPPGFIRTIATEANDTITKEEVQEFFQKPLNDDMIWDAPSNTHHTTHNIWHKRWAQITHTNNSLYNIPKRKMVRL